MLKRKNSSFADKMAALSEKLHLPRSIYAPRDAEDENRLAANAFDWLGPVGSNATPALIEIYRQAISEASQVSALYSLIAVSPPPRCNAFLNEAFTNRDDSVRWIALSYLTPTNTPDVSVPLLIKSLSDRSSSIQNIAASRLSQFGTNALPAVPALVRLACSGPTNKLLSTSSGPWYRANRTLCVLDPQTAARVLTNGFWTYERFTNNLASAAKARSEAATNGATAKRVSGRRRLEPGPNVK